MKALKAGAILLSIWAGWNLLLALAIVAAMTFLGRNAPGLSILFTDAEIPTIETRALATVNGIAVLANACIAGLCLMSLVLVWKGVVARVRWAYWTLVAALVPVQAVGYVSDAYFGHRNLVANLVSTVVLIGGFAVTAYALRSVPR